MIAIRNQRGTMTAEMIADLSTRAFRPAKCSINTTKKPPPATIEAVIQIAFHKRRSLSQAITRSDPRT